MFNPTWGNLLDWSLEANGGPCSIFVYLSPHTLNAHSRVQIYNPTQMVEARGSAHCPAKLRLVEHDVVYASIPYFSFLNLGQVLHEGLENHVCVPVCQCLASLLLSVLLSRSLRPHSWPHMPALDALVRDLHSDLARTIAAWTFGRPQ
jgi:hypothetical protein